MRLDAFLFDGFSFLCKNPLEGRGRKVRKGRPAENNKEDWKRACRSGGRCEKHDRIAGKCTHQFEDGHHTLISETSMTSCMTFV